jgi:hypothetical protein
LIDVAGTTRLLQEAQRQIQALDGFLLAALRGNSLDSALNHSGEALMAAEAAASCLTTLMQQLQPTRAAVQAAETTARHAIGAAMEQTGTLLFPLSFHNMEAAKGQPRIVISDPAKLPGEFWRDREPEPDRLKIAAALKNGPVPGVTVERGPQTVRLSAKSAKKGPKA